MKRSRNKSMEYEQSSPRGSRYAAANETNEKMPEEIGQSSLSPS